MNLSNSNNIESEMRVPYSLWEVKASACQRDLIVKKIAIAILAAANFTGLFAALYYIILYTAIPTKAILVSPFVVGVIAALAYLKFPTCGISKHNYSSYLNPAYMIGGITASLFFGPLMLAFSQIDWTPYHDPIHANKISRNLEKLPFEKVADLYGANFSNMIKYGFIHEKYKLELLELYEQHKPIKKAVDFWQREDDESEELKEAKEAQKELNIKWQALKESFAYPFPYPKKPVLDFSKKTTALKLQYRSTCFDPIKILRYLQT